MYITSFPPLYFCAVDRSWQRKVDWTRSLITTLSFTNFLSVQFLSSQLVSRFVLIIKPAFYQSHHPSAYRVTPDSVNSTIPKKLRPQGALDFATKFNRADNLALPKAVQIASSSSTESRMIHTMSRSSASKTGLPPDATELTVASLSSSNPKSPIYSS